MAHKNKITDKDPCFEVDSITRAIRNVSSTKTTLMQFDHNSERFSFTLPRYIEGHDMAEVTKAEVHYLNVDTPGVYPMNDIAVDESHPDKITCSWLISQNATMKPGSLTFLLRFVCLTADGSIEYAWHTGTFNGISVSAGMNNIADVVEEVEKDFLAQWKAELFAEFERFENNQNVDSLLYYGDANIVPDDENRFEFVVIDPNEKKASVKAKSTNIEGDVVITYKCVIDGETYAVTEISDFGFTDCRKIARVTMPKGITSIGVDAFNSSSVTEIEISDGVTYVGAYAFSLCTNLKKITIPRSVTRIEDGAFYGFYKYDIYYKGTKAQWDAISIGEENETLYISPFYCKWTREVVTISELDVSECNIQIESNTRYNYGMIFEKLNATFDMPNFGDIAEFCFVSPEIIPENYSTFPARVIFKGDGTQDGRFVAEPNTYYTMVFEKLGDRIVGYVSGVSI